MEILFPIEQENLKKKVIHILNVEFQDNVKAHLLQPDDTYVKADRRGKASVNSQEYFVEEAREKVKVEHSAYTGRVFIPEEPVE